MDAPADALGHPVELQHVHLQPSAVRVWPPRCPPRAGPCEEGPRPPSGSEERPACRRRGQADDCRGEKSREQVGNLVEEGEGEGGFGVGRVGSRGRCGGGEPREPGQGLEGRDLGGGCGVGEGRGCAGRIAGDQKEDRDQTAEAGTPPPLPAVVFDQPPPPLELPPGQLPLPPWSTPAPFVPSSPPTPTIPGMWKEYPDAYNVFQMTAEQQASLGFTWLDDRRAAGVVINNSA